MGRVVPRVSRWEPLGRASCEAWSMWDWMASQAILTQIPCISVSSNMETKYRTTFASVPGSVRVVEPTVETLKEAKASLSQLKGLLPAGINPQDEPALLFVAGNIAVAGMVNLNDDGIDCETALEVYKKFEKQQINLEHDRKQVRGYIIHAGLSEFQTDKIITEEEARASGQPFNISVVMALWKTVDRELCDFIMGASSPTNPDFKKLSLSWEIGFEGYRVIGLSIVPGEQTVSIANAKMVMEPDQEGFSRYDSKLRANGGDGLSPDDGNLRLYRVVDEGVIPLGGGVVTMPAAFVKGLTVITEPANAAPNPVTVEANKEEEDRIKQALHLGAIIDKDAPSEEEQKRLGEEAETAVRSKAELASLVAALIEKTSSSLSSQETRVSPNTPKTIPLPPMKDKQSILAASEKATTIDELKQVVASAINLTDVITQESERREKLRVEASEQAAKLEQAKAEAQAASAALQKDLDAVRVQLAEIQNAQASAAAEQKFQERMSALSEVFDVDADSSAFFAEEVKSCDSDDAFAKKMDRFKKLMPEKTKEFKKKKADDAKATIEKYEAALAKEGVKAKFDATTLDITEVIASAKANPVSTTIPNIVKPDETLMDKAKKAFGGLTIGGKTVEQLTKQE